MINNLLSELLELHNNEKISIIGCGGKTTTLFLLANENIKKKILLTTTTKIFKPNNYKCIIGDEKAMLHSPNLGINIIANESSNKEKLSALKPYTLKKIIDSYNLTLVEADGSRGLPIKGWSEKEPVIPDFTTMTIGIITLGALNKNTNEHYVHGVKEFIELTKLSINEKIGLHNIKDCICNNQGMFKNSHGKKILIINKIECLEDMIIAQRLKIMILDDKRINFEKIIIGSAKEGRWING